MGRTSTLTPELLLVIAALGPVLGARRRRALNRRQLRFVLNQASTRAQASAAPAGL
jgi:hypothetical protein